MDWNRVIERNREALKRVLAALVAMAALAGAKTLTRHRHRAILRLLRPAESAARRLIIVAARGLEVVSPPVRRYDLRKRKPAPTLLRGRIGTGIVLPRGGPVPAALAHLVSIAAPRPFAFRLTDPPHRPSRPDKVRPHLVPRISGTDFWSRLSPIPDPPSSDDPIDATRLRLRLAALALALDDLPGRARRFARLKARSDRAAAMGKHRRPPLRIGPAYGRRRPSSRRRPHEVDDVLREVHHFAWLALNPADTS